MYPVWVTTTGANVALKTSTTNLYFNPSTGSMSATIFNSLSDENRKENIVRITDATAAIAKGDMEAMQKERHSVKAMKYEPPEHVTAMTLPMYQTPIQKKRTKKVLALTN